MPKYEASLNSMSGQYTIIVDGVWLKVGEVFNALEERDKLQARVMELEELINEISPATWDDERMKYVNVQVSREVYNSIQSLKGTP